MNESANYAPALLALANGDLFKGFSIGAEGHSVGELVFNTAMTGYQEILTDPSYCQQIVTLTYPHIGNTGINAEDVESAKIQASGLVIRNLPNYLSNWRSKQSLSDYLRSQNRVAIAGVDTRQLTHILREQGALSACITTDVSNPDAAIAAAKAFPGLVGADLTAEVTVNEPYELPATSTETKLHVVVYDFGVKQNILRELQARGCRLTVIPANSTAEQALAYQADAVMLSNGPGDPAACHEIIEQIKKLLAVKVPLMGICLGYQLLALALGAKTEKMKFGHHGANHPVQDLRSKQVYLTSQNHGFTVSEQGLPDCLEVTHRSLFDNTTQGLSHRSQFMKALQGHPEASPGPHDIYNFFDECVEVLHAKAQ